MVKVEGLRVRGEVVKGLRLRGQWVKVKELRLRDWG